MPATADLIGTTPIVSQTSLGSTLSSDLRAGAPPLTPTARKTDDLASDILTRLLMLDTTLDRDV